MPFSDSEPAERLPQSHRFNTTHWSVVLAAATLDSPAATESLQQLCRTYWYPLYAYVRRKGHDPEDAQDLTQQFFARLLQGNRLALADPQRGRFRTFLLSALQNFLVNEWVKASREKRGGGIAFVPLFNEYPENLYAVEPVDERTPETIYEQRWAAAVIARVMERLRAEYRGARERFFEALKDFAWGDKAGTSHAEIAVALGLTEGAVRVAVHRLRRRYRELLREQIAQTVANDAEVEDELRYLVEIVSRRPL